ncbi:MAG: hypothetical protein E7431_02480 [Ruminococcaceae bacterium]|nr:hypothetical protein [Oscillospiraceae bacterium]
MRRYISLACVALIVVMCMVAPVNAASIDNDIFIDVLDYNTDKINIRTLSGDTNSVSFTLPSWIPVRYIDTTVTITGVLPSRISCVVGSSTSTLTCEHIIGGLYRVYGFCQGSSNSLTISFEISGTCWVTFHRFEMSPSVTTTYDIEAYCEIVSAEYNSTIHYVPTDEINHRIFDSTDVYTDTFFYCYIWSDDWKLYDYIDFQLMFSCLEITSVTAVMGSINVPLSVSYIDGTSIDGNSFYYSMRMDVTGLDRTSNDYPMIVLMGRLNTGILNSVQFANCSGHVAINNFNPLFYYFSNLITSVSAGFSNVNAWISSQTNAIVSAIRGDSAPGNNFQDDVSQKDSELKDMVAIMDSVSKPDINNISVEVNDYVDPNILASSMSGISTVAASPIFSDVLLMAIILATAGYVLYGKR